MSQYTLCKLADLKDLEAREFSINTPMPSEVFLIKKDKQIFAYLNSCPHTGAPLNWQPNMFLNIQKNKILCTMHGALFDIETGYCNYGPCAGDYLKKLPVSIKGDTVTLELE